VKPFVIFALPRSRTYWLSRFLTYGGSTCGHDETRHVRSVEDVRSWLAQDQVGTVETAAAPFWRLLLKERPDAKVLVVRRPVAEVVDSLMRLGIAFDREALTTKMHRLDRKLDVIERRFPGAQSVRFSDLAHEAACKEVFEYCLPFAHDPLWWAQISAVNLQINLPALLRYEQAHAVQLRRAERLCTQQIQANKRSDKVRLGPIDRAGITIQQEGWHNFYRDGGHLFTEHCKAVGEPEDEWRRKNLPMLDQLEDAGAWQVITARSNGRMLAYLMTLVGPSLEACNRITGTQTLFFASKDVAGMGLGMVLQRMSLDLLKKRGVHEVIMRAGVRGSGPKLGTLYRRLGAEEFGHLYRLKLKAA